MGARMSGYLGACMAPGLWAPRLPAPRPGVCLGTLGSGPLPRRLGPWAPRHLAGCLVGAWAPGDFGRWKPGRASDDLGTCMAPGRLGTWAPCWHLGAWPPGHLGSAWARVHAPGASFWMPGHLGASAAGYLGAWGHGWAPRHLETGLGTWAPRQLGRWVLGHLLVTWSPGPLHTWHLTPGVTDAIVSGSAKIHCKSFEFKSSI